MPLERGSRLGPYEIVAPLGAGGMGVVYRARDTRLGRDVAVKVLTGESGADPERLRRFEHEARAVAALSHPNVLALYDVGVGPTPFLVTELLEGETLRTLVARGPLPPRRAIDLTLQIAAGLAAAHARGIVHRDLKPENVFVTADGHVKVLDFGLASETAAVGMAEPATRLQTLPGMVMGTIGYMAPEQLRGLAVDARTDVFACGIILAEMLTGERLYRGASPADTISAILTQPPNAIMLGPSVPPALAAIVRRALEKEPNHRFSSAKELGLALEALTTSGSGSLAAVPATDRGSVAVLPFLNISADPENQYFSDGLSEDLINALTRLSGLRVASRTSSFRFRDSDADVREIGRVLGVSALLEGSVRRAGARLRITARLTNTADGYHIWSERYDRELADVFAIQDDIVDAIVTALAPSLVGEEPTAIRRSTQNLHAYEHYLKGRHFWNQRSPAVMGAAIRHFEEAIAIDPGYALAYAGLADCYSILRVYGLTPPDESRPRALQAVNTALALAPDLPEAHFAYALYTFHFEPGWRDARQHFVSALALSPESALFHAYVAVFLATEYDEDGARTHLNRAVALDAQSSAVHFLASCAACAMGDADLAARHVEQALVLDPESLAPLWPQTVALLMTGRYEEALSGAAHVISRTRAPIYLGVLAMVYGLAGRRDEAEQLVRELHDRRERGEYVVPVAHLSAQLGLSDVDRIRAALAACLDGAAAPFAIIATGRPWLDRYRSDPEIDRLLDRLHDGARPRAAT
jgi:eukaryotic-like serine/threonine-protein kinase